MEFKILTEREKMLSGLMYNAMDEDLLEGRNLAEDLYREYNLTKNNLVLPKLFGSIGENIVVKTPFYCDYGCNIYLGDNCYINRNCVILDCAKVVIGNNCLIGPNAQIYSATHTINPKERLDGVEYAKEVIIGNNVNIGGSAVICPGVTIGDNVTIEAGCVVTKSIPDNSYVIGNPCIITVIT